MLVTFCLIAQCRNQTEHTLMTSILLLQYAPVVKFSPVITNIIMFL